MFFNSEVVQGFMKGQASIQSKRKIFLFSTVKRWINNCWQSRFCICDHCKAVYAWSWNTWPLTGQKFRFLKKHVFSLKEIQLKKMTWAACDDTLHCKRLCIPGTRWWGLGGKASLSLFGGNAYWWTFSGNVFPNLNPDLIFWNSMETNPKSFLWN